MRKLEVGKSNPTFNKVSGDAENVETKKWLDRIYEIQASTDTGAQAHAIADVLVELIGLVNEGKVNRSVVSQVVDKAKVTLSLRLATNKLRGTQPIRARHI